MEALKLFPFQKEACVSLWEVARRARQSKTAGGAGGRCLAVQPTGSGKTVEILAFVRATSIRWKWRALVIVPSKELVRQTWKKAKKFIPDVAVGMIVAGKCQIAGVEMVISTAASLHKQRLAKIDPNEFHLVIVDEAHHASAKSYKAILDHFAPATLMIGMTAIDRRKWVKVHLMCGVATHIVTAVQVSKPSAGDSPYFKPLVQATDQNFDIREVSADKAYSSLANLRVVADKQAMPFIPFKINAKAEHQSKDPLWTRMYHFYAFNQEWFKEHYHKRSNVETTFSMIKEKFGTRLLSKKEVAQVNEVLCKVLCHNISVVIQSMYELGIEPVFWTDEKGSKAS